MLPFMPTLEDPPEATSGMHWTASFPELLTLTTCRFRMGLWKLVEVMLRCLT